jgi:glycosyltransferase involved in cell wall biosynthesis
MKILVYPHDLGMGGSQLNAIEIAAAVSHLGHEVAIFGRPGTLVSRIQQLGLEFIESPQPRRRPSPSVVRALVDLIDDRGFEIIHGYEWPPTLEAVLATRRRRSAVAVSTVMSMAVAPFIPRSTPLLVGTAEIESAERALGRRRVGLLEPPVDLSFNGPDIPVDVDGFRRRFGINPSKAVVVSVTRFARELKLEGTIAAIDAIGGLAGTLPIQLVLVGDGPERAQIEARATAVNATTGENTIVITGQLDDPRAAYSIADVALGMGGSALRALAFEKPLIVQGEIGFWKLLTPESLDQFLLHGWYGVGSSVESGAPALASILSSLLPDEPARESLARFGRSVVEQRFSLTGAAEIQVEEYRSAMLNRSSQRAEFADHAAGAARYVRYYLDKRVKRALGSERSDDFNAKPVRAVRRASRAETNSHR